MNSSQSNIFMNGLSNDLCSPCFSHDDKLYLILQNNAEVISIDTSGHISSVVTTNGQPSGITFIHDQGNTILYIADIAIGSILSLNNGNLEACVQKYENRPLLGPNSIISYKNIIYFTDSGPFGETGVYDVVSI